MPYGSTKPENLERFADDRMFVWPDPGPSHKRGPMYIFYDQEPIYGEFNYELFDYIRDNFMGPFILVTTEKNSGAVDHISQKYGWPVVYYFHHVFAAHDWFRGSRYHTELTPIPQRRLKKKFISFNRLTSSRRVYRSLLLANLADSNLLDSGYISYNEICPEGGHYKSEITNAVADSLITTEQADRAINILDKINFPLRIDYRDHTQIPNHSFSLSAVRQTQESFCYIVTETCFWERKYHLTEKIFKPIISHMPFVLVGPAHNLKYLREYGFKTFNQWFDESYDDIEDPVERLTAITKTIKQISEYSLEDLQNILLDMQPVLEHNYRLFNSQDFLDRCWKEMVENLAAPEVLNGYRLGIDFQEWNPKYMSNKVFGMNVMDPETVLKLTKNFEVTKQL